MNEGIDDSRLQEDLRIEGTLQGKILATLSEGSFSGSEIMRSLGLSSPGTIYPALKVLREKGLIEYAPEQVPGKKLYVLTETGVIELKKIMLGIGRGLFYRYLSSYAPLLVGILKELKVEITPETKVLSTILYEPVRRWLEKADATFLTDFKEIPDTYHLILCGGIATLMAHGWRKDDFTRHLSTLVGSLEPGGTFIILENEKTENIFVEIFFKEVLGLSKITGLSKEELRDLLEGFNLRVSTILSQKGVLLGISTKPR